ncbi:hypothetical protein HDU82_003072, partial [Entophlyctis luteolus]
MSNDNRELQLQRARQKDERYHTNMHATTTATPSKLTPTFLALASLVFVDDAVEDADDDIPAASIDDVNATPLPDVSPSLATANPTCLFPKSNT